MNLEIFFTQEPEWFLFQATCTTANFMGDLQGDACGDGLRNKKAEVKCISGREEMGIRYCSSVAKATWNILYFILPGRKSCSGMCWEQGGAEVAAGSSEPVELFAFFCQDLGSVSQNNQLCCPLICHHRHLVQQRAELPPQHNSGGDLFREKAGPLSWVWESCCVLASFFWKFFLSLEETSHASNSCTCI